ncbi:elongator complex protein 3 [Desulfosudis oleivorans]|uniref:Radical SAM domain protein n=1 Tax=Desulfosudis oleivorans (strain DSM 6200 / JCM 39069 / Hxd3) TaxID=96561 RepID=A8ZZF2_DESOH|nr:radical SAM protein [Desulfosudis oleivorans]ABW67305.1 Radical SAM domain protein [Desulfosudis oleivorans Hxd3]
MTTGQRPFIVPVFLPHAGCPHRCVFCDQDAITGQKASLTADDLHDHVHRYLQYRGDNRGHAQIAFYGGNFLGLERESLTQMLHAASAFVDQGLVQAIRFSTRPDTITQKNLDLLKDYPVTTVEVGVQSMDDRVLEKARRGHTAEQSTAALLLLKQAGYETGAQLMTGLPGDDGRVSIETAKKVAVLKPDFARIYPTLVITGSPLARHYRQGEYMPQTLDAAVAVATTMCLTLESQGITVIRMGLQPSEELADSATLLAGPYHPAFGHLVRSEILFDRVSSLIADRQISPGADLTLAIHPRQASALRGQKNANLARLKKRFDLKSIRILEDPALAEDQTICQ